MEQRKIDRINELARKAKSGELTECEKKERDELRQEFLTAFRTNLNSTLNRIVIVDEKGKKVKFIKNDKNDNADC